VSYQTNWRAQAEHGGFYQAVAAGIYKKHGIDCDLRMGGPQISNSQLLMGGRVDMIMSGGLEALNYAKEDLPFLCIGAIFQKDPQVLIAHPGVGNDSFEKLKGKTILVGAGGRVTYWPFLKAKYGYSDDQMKPYTFNLAPFLADKNLVQQGFVSSEPYAIRQTGVDPVVLLIAERASTTTTPPSRPRRSSPPRRRIWPSASSTPASKAGRNISRAGPPSKPPMP
jgi:NitT/TauT family transport system substrate-binding protein